MSRDPRTECAARRVTRERIACGAVGVAMPSTRRASDKLCHVCHRGDTCAEAGVPAGTLRGETSTTPVTHRCVRCGERDVHGVRHERARTWNVERWATTPLRDPQQRPGVSDGETADRKVRSRRRREARKRVPFRNLQAPDVAPDTPTRMREYGTSPQAVCIGG